MSEEPGIILLILNVLILIAVIIRVLLRPHREPASRIAWIVVIISLPVVGVLAYLLLGETNIGRRRVACMREVISRLPDVGDADGTGVVNLQTDIPAHYAQLFQAGKTVNGFAPIGGNRAHLMQDSNATITSMVADIDV